MEDIIISIDSKYRDIYKYPNESKFTLNLDKIYKNVVSVNLDSIELTSNINIISMVNKNNYLTLYLPNKLNDDKGIVVPINEIVPNDMESILNVLNYFITNNINNNLTTINAERYFYLFYLYNNCTITFDFNSILTPKILLTPLIIIKGWYSLYGLVNIILNYIQSNYDARKIYKNNNPNSNNIDLDDGNFIINSFTLDIYDKRIGGNIRSDVINLDPYTLNNIIDNKNKVKTDIYSTYITDITTFIISSSNSGILDIILYNYGPIYYFGSLYNMSISSSNNSVTITTTTDTDSFTPYDIPQFQVDFSNDTRYSSLGYYLGFRPINNSFLLTPTLNSNYSQLILTNSKNHNLTGYDYLFLKINDWGKIDLFNQNILSKIYLRSNLTTINKTNNIINKEYIFRQLMNIAKLDIEIVDYLGNNVNLNGYDFSLTLSLKTQVNIDRKQNLIYQVNGII